MKNPDHSQPLPTIGSLRLKRVTPTLLASALALGAAYPATAQQAAPAAAPIDVPAASVEGERPNDPATSYKVDQSASPKFTAPLLDTPRSVTVITREVMEERGTPSLQDVLRTVPGITLGQGEGGSPNGDRPSIRGFSSESNVTVDGMRLGAVQTGDTLNIDQVEILKGPNSAYSGRGSAGGSINLVTKTAKNYDFQDASVTFGTDLTKRVSGDVNYVVNDQIGVRLNAVYHDADVAGRDEVDINRWGAAPTITFGLNSPTKATIGLLHWQTDDIPDYGHPYDPRTGKPVDVDRDNFYGLTKRDYQMTQLDAATLRLEHEFNEHFTLSNQTRYSVSSNEQIVTTPNDSAPNNIENGYVYRSPKSRNSQAGLIVNQTDLKGEFETASLKHNYIAGFEISKENSKNRGYIIGAGASNQCTALQISLGNCTSLLNPNPNDDWVGSIEQSNAFTDTKVDTWAFYAFDTVQFNPQWSINFGARFDSYSTRQDARATNGTTTTLENTADIISYQAGLVYKPVPYGSIYISYGTSSTPSGATAGEGTDNISANNVSLDPEENVNYEIGTKWDLFRGQLTTTAALYRNEKTNMRVTGPDGTQQVLGGEARIDGLELGLAGAITDKWKVFGGYSLMLSELVDDGPMANNDGKELPNTPMNSLSLWSTYDILKDVTLGGGAIYMSSREGSVNNTRWVPEFWRFDAMASYKLSETVDLRLNINNIFDETYYDKPYTNHMAGVAPGRVALLTTNFKF